MIENSRNRIFVRVEKGKSGDLLLARRRLDPSPSRDPQVVVPYRLPGYER
jgi:hypothetical protein